MSILQDVASRIHDVECHVSTTHELVDAAAMAAAEIGDDDPRAQAAYDAAFAVLCGTKPLSLDEAAGRLRFLAYVGREFIGDAGTQQDIHAAMVQVAAWLARAAVLSSAHAAGCAEPRPRGRASGRCKLSVGAHAKRDDRPS